MVQSNQAVWGVMEQEIRSYKGPPSLADHRALELRRQRQGFLRRLLLHEPGRRCRSLGPASSHRKRGLWGQRLLDEMERYNHQVGLKMVGECLPQERNRVTLADEKDQYGLPIARVTYRFCDNDKRMIRHALGFMRPSLAAAGASEIFDETDDTCHLNGTARMGDDPRDSVVNADCRSLGHSQSVDLRRLGVSDRRRRQSVPDHPGHRLPDGRPHQGAGGPRRVSDRGGSRRRGHAAGTKHRAEDQRTDREPLCRVDRTRPYCGSAGAVRGAPRSPR